MTGFVRDAYLTLVESIKDLSEGETDENAVRGYLEEYIDAVMEDRDQKLAYAKGEFIPPEEGFFARRVG